MLERPEAVPDAPGSYQFKDADGRVIYVGKAPVAAQRAWPTTSATPASCTRAPSRCSSAPASVEWIQVRSDVEAIMLEYNLIKAHRPRFNVRLVDDKSYPYLAVTLDESWPRATVMRGAKRKGTRYFGPYAHAYAIRETLDLLLRSFPIRTCTDAKFRRHERLGRPCLLYHIERCSAARASARSTRRPTASYVEELMDVPRRRHRSRSSTASRREMREAAAALEFERAARLRDQLDAVRLASERQEMVVASPEELRRGRDRRERARGRGAGAPRPARPRGRPAGLRPREGRAAREPPSSSGGPSSSTTPRRPLGCPARCSCPSCPTTPTATASGLPSRRGRRVAIHVPQRGRKRALLDMARANAAEQLAAPPDAARERPRRAGPGPSTSCRSYLGLAEPPLRIECYDMSHLQGSDYVGSMVVMEDGLPKRSDYRRFKVSAVQGNDDYGAMHEVLTRRLKRLLEEETKPPPADQEGRARRAASPTRPSCSSSTAGRASSAWACGSSRSSA